MKKADRHRSREERAVLEILKLIALRTQRQERRKIVPSGERRERSLRESSG